jgi:transcriptional regulator with XRE-family HTH domain
VAREELNQQWSTAIRLAQRNGASLREIAAATGVAPQTISKIPKDARAN